MKIKILSVLFISSFVFASCNSTHSTSDDTTNYLVSYLPNGGSGDLFTESIKENTRYLLKECMYIAPSGYEFNAWLIDGTSYQVNDEIIIKNDLDILATYKEEGSTTNYYIVSFNPGNGSGYMAPVTIEEGFTYKLPSSTFTNPLGYDFYRWSDGLTTYKVGAEVTINEDTTFTAIYIENQKDVYTVSFSSNGGSGNMPSVEVEEGLYNLPECSFTAPSNKKFDYWSISTGSTHYQPGNPINVTSDVVVTANWTNLVPTKYTLSFSSNGGNGTMSSMTRDENSWDYLPTCTFTAPNNKEFDCYQINGKYYEEGQAYQFISNATAYAIWKDKEVDPPEEWEDDKVKLECGYYNMGKPSNIDSPIALKTTLSADDSSWLNTTFSEDLPNNYRYIYKNSCSDGPSGHKCSPSYYSAKDGGGLKINNPGTGFGSPAFTHTGAKLEIRIGISPITNASGTPEKGKDTFHIYYFDKDNNYLGKSVIEEGTVTTKTTFLKVYYTESNAVNVSYFEFRCNAQPYKSSQQYNVGISYCNIKSWERA